MAHRKGVAPVCKLFFIVRVKEKVRKEGIRFDRREGELSGHELSKK